jgi:hypothetical protein
MRSADLGLAFVCFVCFAIGMPANGISFNYFRRKTGHVTIYIYIAVSALDTFTSVMVLPVGKSAFK